MNNTEQLRQLMTLDANINTTDIEERFERIAKMLFESFAIQKGEKKSPVRMPSSLPVKMAYADRMPSSVMWLHP